jgi:predicted nucleotidyltransferase
VLGFRESRDNYVWRTQPEGARSGPGDTDLIIYNLKKFLKLAVKGNPTVLVPLFAPEAAILKEHELGKELRAIRSSFLSKEAGERFLGYMHGQHERMLGQSNRNVPNRPELVEKYGYDVKYASHALRLAVQGYEIISQGTLTLPMPPRDRELVLQVKYGEVQKDVVSKWISELEAMCRKKLDENNTPLPKTADIELITDWAVSAQTRFWAES